MAITDLAHWSAYWAEHVKTINALLIKWRIPPNNWKTTLKERGKWSWAQWAEGKTVPGTNRPCVSGERQIYLVAPSEAPALEDPILFSISCLPTPIITHTLGWHQFPCCWGQAWTCDPPVYTSSVQLAPCWGSKPGLGQCSASTLPTELWPGSPPPLPLQVIFLSEGFSLSLFALPILYYHICILDLAHKKIITLS